MVHTSFVQLAGVVFIVWILTQPAAHAQSADDVQALDSRAIQLYEKGQYLEAAKLEERALTLAEQTLGPEHPDTLKSVNGLGLIYKALGRYDEAASLHQRALAGREKVVGPEHPDTLKSVNNLAIVYQLQGRYDEAEPLFKRALANKEKALGSEHPTTLTSVYNLGLFYLTQRRYDEAEPLLKQALAGKEKELGPKHADTLKCVSALAFLYQGQGRYGQAEPLYRTVLASRREALGPEHPDTLKSVTSLAALYHLQGRYDEAEPLFRQALAGNEKALGPEHPDTLTSVAGLGLIYWAQRRYSEVEPLYRRVLAGNEKALGPEHPSTLASIAGLGLLYQAQRRYSEAEPFLKQALAGYEKVLKPDHPSTLASVAGLGLFYLGQGRDGEAEPLLKRALAGHEKALGPEHPDTLTSLANLGIVYLRQKRYGEAEPLFKRALAGREKTLGPEHPDTLASVSNLGLLYERQGAWENAARYWRRSTAGIIRRVVRGALDVGLTGKKESEAQRANLQFQSLIQAAFHLIPKGQTPDRTAVGETFQSAQWALSSEVAQSLAQMAARGAKGDPVLAGLARERQDLVNEWQVREKLQAAALGQETAKRNAKAETENRERMAAIDARIGEIDTRLKDTFPDYAALTSSAPLPVEQVQAQLGADEALVLFLNTFEETFIWVVTKTEMRWARSDLGQTALVREVAALRCGLDWAAWEGQSRCPELTGQNTPGRLLPFDHARAYRLYQALFGEIGHMVKGKHLLIVPSGALTQLPFAVLETAPPQGDNRSAAWLARDHAITVLPAVSSLGALRTTGRPSAAAKPLIGFGNPLLNGDGENSPAAKLAREKQACPKTAWQRVAARFGFRGAVAPIETDGRLSDVSLIRSLAPLPETADELCAVASDVGADLSEIRLGARATEHEVKALSLSGELARHRIVHFATHGATAGELNSGSEPGLILTPPKVATEDDDGYLTASEIAALKLDAEWVILSACNTAAGNASNAEALSGLARAFIYAQARALLVSHWAVNSNATVKLITAAMRDIATDKSVGRAEALRHAMLELIDRGDPDETHPAYWAPFIVVGEGGR